jgi:hypothetical protein
LGVAASHPKTDICADTRLKKALSYIIELCQLSFWLFDPVDKGGRCRTVGAARLRRAERIQHAATFQSERVRG